MPILPVILAAGTGYRLGMPKVFYEYQGKTFFSWILEALTVHYQSPAVVIQADYYAKLCVNYHQISKWVINPFPERGMISSIRTALAEYQAENYCLIPIDFPFVTMQTYQKLAEINEKFPDTIVKPVFRGQGGHPLIIPYMLAEKIRLASQEQTLREIISGSDIYVHRVEVEDAGVLRNINTVADLCLDADWIENNGL
jgi:molybdenum cofactor cytidylyltransferase